MDSSAGLAPTSPVTTTSGMSISDSASSSTGHHQLGNRLQSPGGIPLSPLTEAQELPISDDKNGSCDTLENSRLSIEGSSTSLDSATHMHLGTGSQPGSHTVGRNRTTSLGAAARQQQQQQQQQSMYQQCYPPTQATPNSTATHYQQPNPNNMVSSPLTSNNGNNNSAGTNHYGAGQAAKSNNRLSRNLSNEMDDSVSEKSSVSDTLSIKYQPTKTTGTSLASNYMSFARNNSTYSSLLPAKYANRLSSATPVAIGGLLAKGSYRFAKVQFTLPPMAEMSPVSSVFLDYEYTVDITMSIGGSFGSTKKATGKLPLKIVTGRRQPGSSGSSTKYRSSGGGGGAVGRDSSGGSSSGSSQVLGDQADNGGAQSLGDSLSCLNLMTQSEETSAVSKGSPTTTLTNFRFEGGNSGGAKQQEENANYPCLLTFLENGEKVPMPVLESINIGSNIM
ncbi:hypothetical protein LPJ59_005679 [Coemansia sp. RSA 2399]|nr:hypothetical protein LPJ59_005679 [Coemansia sp. RSA 2399]